jgi:hypothetical protein
MKVILLFIGFSSAAQTLHHESVGSLGSGVVTLNGFGITQTIGQQSPSGTNYKKGYVIQQGFQQSLHFQNNGLLKAESLKVRVYPNPFVSEIIFDFDSEISGDVEVNLFDSLGRLIYNYKNTPSQNRLSISSLTNLAEGSYFVTLVASNFQYSTHLVKSK